MQISCVICSNSFLASGDFCDILKTIANILDPDLDPNCLTLIVFLNDIFEKVNFEKSQQTT